VGFRNTPVNSQSAAYETVLADSGKTILHPVADDNARTFTIPANSTVAYPVGTVISFVNLQNTVTIVITTDTMYLANDGDTGDRTLAEYGMASAMKVAEYDLDYLWQRPYLRVDHDWHLKCTFCFFSWC
jgi:hypothetical protein